MRRGKWRLWAEAHPVPPWGVVQDATGGGTVSTPKSLDWLAQYAAHIGLTVKIEETGQGYRVLVDAQADLVLDERLTRYIEDDMGMGLDDDLTAAPSGWRRLGVIVGMREVKD